MKRSAWKMSGGDLVAMVALLLGLILYLVTSLTGYMANQGLNPVLLVCTILSFLVLLPVWPRIWQSRPFVPYLRLLLSEVLLLLAFSTFIMSRVRLAADVYFIPVNFPPEELTALNISVVGVIAYLVAILAVIVQVCRNREPVEAALDA